MAASPARARAGSRRPWRQAPPLPATKQPRHVQGRSDRRPEPSGSIGLHEGRRPRTGGPGPCEPSRNRQAGTRPEGEADQNDPDQRAQDAGHAIDHHTAILPSTPRQVRQEPSRVLLTSRRCACLARGGTPPQSGGITPGEHVRASLAVHQLRFAMLTAMNVRRIFRKIHRFRVPVLGQLEVPAIGGSVGERMLAERAFDEGWLNYLEDEPPSTPLHGSINELARRLRHYHHAGDGCDLSDDG